MEAQESKEFAMEVDGEEENEPPPLQAASPSLFPLFGAASASASASATPSLASHAPRWLSNSSFTADASAINTTSSAAFSGSLPSLPDSDEDAPGDGGEERRQGARVSYEMVESSESDREMERRERRRKKKKRRGSGVEGDVASDRKASVRVWADSGGMKPAKEYFFDLKGDRDNLAFGSLYRYDSGWFFVRAREKDTMHTRMHLFTNCRKEN